jgi:nucleoside-diphosphate-sugar epimerase
MNVLVTGATGFVGGHLVPHLVQAGHRVYAQVRDPGRLAQVAGDVRAVVCDLRDRDAIAALPDRVDTILHLAQWNGPLPDTIADLFEVNTGSTLRLLEYARRTGVKRFVLASTGSVYGGQRSAGEPWSEGDPDQGAGYYPATKVAAERLVQACGADVPYTIFRLFAPYGPGQAGRMVPGLISRVRSGEPVTVAGGRGPRFNPIYVADAAGVFEQSLAAQGNQVVNLGGDEALSIREMALAIGRVLGREAVFQDVPGTPVDVVGDIARLRQLYRLPPRLTTFEEGVRRMVAAA